MRSKKGWEYISGQGYRSEAFRYLREAKEDAKEALEVWGRMKPLFRRVGTLWSLERKVRVVQTDGSDNYPAGRWRWHLTLKSGPWSDGGWATRAIARERGRIFARSVVMERLSRAKLKQAEKAEKKKAAAAKLKRAEKKEAAAA